MVDDVAAVHELAYDGGRQHRVDDEMEPLALAKMEDIGLLARREVVEGEDFPTLVEQQLAQMGADEAGTTGNEGLPDHGGEGYRRQS